MHESNILSDMFNYVAKHNLWRNNESISGYGSTLDATKSVRDCLNHWIEKYQIKSIVDCACGDMNWQIFLTKFQELNYRGFDISNHVQTMSKYPISILDITKQVPPGADLILLRDVLQHLPLKLARSALENVIRAAISRGNTSITYIAVTSFESVKKNDNIDAGDFFRNNINYFPFPKIPTYPTYNTPLEKCFNYAGAARGEYPDMFLYLYKIVPMYPD